MMKPREMFNKITAEVKAWEWIVLIIAITLPLISFLYGDTNSIIRCGIDVTKSIRDGQFWQYYDYTLLDRDRGYMVHPPTYDILFYITVGIWEIPVAVAEMVTGTYLKGNTLAMCYSKCLLLVFLILSAWVVYKIAVKINFSSKIASWTAFMFMSGGFIFAYIGIAGQYDIMGLFFTLLGVYYYLKNDTKRFIFWFAIAVQYKFFPLFIFIPLVLLKQKNLLKIALHMILVMIPLGIMRIPFLNDFNALAEKNEIQADMIDRIFRNRIPIFETEVPLSLLFVGAVCLFCYWKDIKESEENYYAVFVPFLVMAALFLSFPFFPYWVVYLSPWMALLFFMRKEKSERRFMFELGMSICVILAQFSHFDWVFELDNTVDMFMDKVTFPYESFTNPLTMSNFNTILPIETSEPLLFGMYILCLAALVVSYWPREHMDYQTDEYPCRRMMWIRFIISFMIGAIPFLLYLGSIARQIVFG